MAGNEKLELTMASVSASDAPIEPELANIRSGLVAEQTNVAALADDVAIHRFQNVGSRGTGRKVEFGVQSVELENVMVSGTTFRRAGGLITIHAADVFALHPSVVHGSIGLDALRRAMWP